MSEPQCSCEKPGRNGLGRCPNCWMPAGEKTEQRVIGWRVPPYGRVAHLLIWDPCGDRCRYTTACGAVFVCAYIDYVPNAKRCARCRRATEKATTEGGDRGNG